MKLAKLNKLPFEPNVHNPQILKRVLIKNGQIPHLTNLTQATFPPKVVASEHSHQDMIEVFFVEKGTANIKINGHDIVMEEGDCMTVELEESHEVSNPSDQDLIITYFGIVVPNE